MARLTIDTIRVGDDPGAWRKAGFDADEEGNCQVGTVVLQLEANERGIRDWSVRGLEATEIDGLLTQPSTAPERTSAGIHPNGVTSIDHVVVFTNDRTRTTAALEEAGLDLRRLRDEPTPAGGGFQAFFRLGEVILEVIEQPQLDSNEARFWGLSFTVESLDRAAALLGDNLSEPRDAVQPGRKIATLKREAGLAVPVAFMTPGPGAA